MNATNLALVFAPTLFWQKKTSDALSDSPYTCKLVELLISNHRYFFSDHIQQSVNQNGGNSSDSSCSNTSSSSASLNNTNCNNSQNSTHT
jgi:hypothetical protein